MSPDAAQTIALQALGWIVGEDDLFTGFLSTTGGGIDDLRARAADPAFQAAVLDYLTTEDRWVMRFCDHVGLPYDAPLRARHALPGSELVHWT